MAEPVRDGSLQDVIQSESIASKRENIEAETVKEQLEENKPLKPGWTEHVSPDGIPYYYNEETNESTWIRPVIDETPEKTAAETLEEPKITGDSQSPDQTSLAIAVEKGVDGIKDDNEKIEKPSREFLKRKLEASDAVLDPDITKYLKEWLDLQSEEERSTAVTKAIESLSNSYHGYPDMLNLVLEWFKDLENSSSGNEQIGGTLALGVVHEHVKKLVQQRFEGGKEAIASFLENNKDLPQWLLRILDNKAWRNLLIVLAGDPKNKQIPFLDFCVKAMTLAGHHSEIANVTNPSAYFSVFLRTFEDLLIKIITCHETLNLYELERQFYKLCSHVQYTHLFAMEVLRSLEGGDIYDITSSVKPSELSLNIRCKCRRLRQGLAESTRGDVKRIAATELLSPLHRKEHGALSNKMSGFPELASLLKGAIDRRSLSPEILTRFFDLYNPDSNLFKGDHGSVRMPPIWPLRLPIILGLLTKQLFQPFRSNIQGSQDTTGSYLLACATVRPGASPTDQPEKVFLIAKETQAETLEVQKSIRSCLQIVNSEETLSIKGLHRQSEGIQILVTNMKTHPVISAGVLLWIRACYCAPKFQRSTAFTTGVITFMYLIRVSIRSQPLQRAQVFVVLCQIFPLKPESVFSTKMLELKQYIIDEMIVLMQVGYVLPVVDFMRSQAENGDIDHSLLRHFVIRLLKLAGPPFSQEFTNSLKLLLKTKSCTRALRTGLSPDLSKLVNELIEDQDIAALNATLQSKENGTSHKFMTSTHTGKRETIKLVPFK